MAFEVLHKEVKPLGLKVSCAKTYVQSFESLLNDTIQFVHAFSEDIEVTKSFTYLGGVVHGWGLTRKSLDGLAWSSVLWSR